jgi:hypothetical protein
MNMRDKIVQVLLDTPTRNYGKQADAIVAVLPDYDAQQARIAELESALKFMPEVLASLKQTERDVSLVSDLEKATAAPTEGN